MLLSMFSFLYLPKWSHEENVNCPHLYHVITWTEMGSYTLNVGVLEYFLFWGFCPLSFLSFRPFLLWCFIHFGFSLSTHMITWRECWLSTPVSCDLMNRSGIVHLDCWSIRIFSVLGIFYDLILSIFAFVLWCFCQFYLFSVHLRDRMARILIVNTCIMWSHEQKWDRTPWLLEY